MIHQIFIIVFILISLGLSRIAPPLNHKCIWIVRHSLYSKEDIDSALIYAYNSGYDKLFVQVRGRGDAFYNSKYVKKNGNINGEFDPLRYTLKLGHALGLEIHAWFNTYILWSANSDPEDSNHILFQNPTWTEADQYGKMDYSIELSGNKYPNWEGIFLSPLHPEVNKYLFKLIKEIIDEYNVDGIHLDYIRFQDKFYGFNPEGCRKFDSIYGVDPRDLKRGLISKRFGYKQSYIDSVEHTWNQYKINSINNLLVMLKKYESKLKKEVIISAAVKPNIIEAKDRWFQDWVNWIELNLIDYAVVMNYTPNNLEFNSLINLMNENINIENKHKIIMGIAAYNQEAKLVVDKIKISQLNGFNSISIFSYNAHENNLNWFEPIIKHLD